MPFYYRKRKGGLNFSASKKGVRVSRGFGCLFALLVLVAVGGGPPR
jgi:hypothetical protein